MSQSGLGSSSSKNFSYNNFQSPKSMSTRVMNAKKSSGGKKKKILQSVGKELKNNPPRILAKTAKKKGKAAANKQRVAILLSKARKAGAKIPGDKKA